MKGLRFVVFGFLIFYSFLSFAASPIPISRKSTVKQIESTYKEAQSLHDPVKQAYRLSMPMYAAALVNKRHLFQKILPAMQSALEQNGMDSYAAWLYGRLLVSAKLMRDNGLLKQVQEKMLSMLTSGDLQGNVAMRTWAWAYLASIYSPRNIKQFAYAKKHFLSSLDQQIEQHDSKTDLMWSITMGMLAAGKNFDAGLYRRLLNDYLYVALKQRSIVSAIQQVPIRDYRVWLIADLRVAAKLMQDEDLEKALVHPLQQAYRSTKDPDALMMAKAMEWRYLQ